MGSEKKKKGALGLRLQCSPITAQYSHTLSVLDGLWVLFKLLRCAGCEDLSRSTVPTVHEVSKHQPERRRRGREGEEGKRGGGGGEERGGGGKRGTVTQIYT